MGGRRHRQAYECIGCSVLAPTFVMSRSILHLEFLFVDLQVPDDLWSLSIHLDLASMSKLRLVQARISKSL